MRSKEPGLGEDEPKQAAPSLQRAPFSIRDEPPWGRGNPRAGRLLPRGGSRKRGWPHASPPGAVPGAQDPPRGAAARSRDPPAPLLLLAAFVPAGRLQAAAAHNTPAMSPPTRTIHFTPPTHTRRDTGTGGPACPRTHSPHLPGGGGGRNGAGRGPGLGLGLGGPPHSPLTRAARRRRQRAAPPPARPCCRLPAGCAACV